MVSLLSIEIFEDDEKELVRQMVDDYEDVLTKDWEEPIAYRRVFVVTSGALVGLASWVAPAWANTIKYRAHSRAGASEGTGPGACPSSHSNSPAARVPALDNLCF
ncbi:MAG: hypothetical protein ACYSTL_07670 [Planctomycetota bacterium]|jgi:hypothetical protein